MTGPWTHRVGDVSTRTELVHQYGGNINPGIMTARESKNIFIFSDPVAGAEFGYAFDGLSEEGQVFNYTGQGKVGD